MRVYAPGPARRMLWLLGPAGLLASGASYAAARAPGGVPPPATLSTSARPGTGENQVGSGFRRGMVEAAFSAGGGIGIHAFGGKRTHDLALVTGRYGRGLGSNWELLIEMFGGVQTQPRSRSVFGLTPIIRYNFATGSRWVPFIDGGVGPTLTSIRDRDLSTAFEFNVQVGTGAHYFVGRNRALSFQYRWLHLSNAGIRRPNDGTNTQMLYAGMTWFY